MAVDLDTLKSELITEIKSNRKSWNFTEIPQIVFLFLFVVGLTFMTGFGLYISITAIKEGSDVSGFMESVKFYVTGSSSLLGFVVFKLMKRLSEVSKSFLDEHKVFSGTVNMIRATNSQQELVELMKEYYKR